MQESHFFAIQIQSLTPEISPLVLFATGVWTEYVTVLLLNAALLLALSSVVYGFYWFGTELHRYLTSSTGQPSHVSLRVLPFLASLSLFIMLGLLMYALMDVPSLREPTFASVGFTVMSFVFVAFAALSFFISLRSFQKPAPAWLRWHSLIVSLALIGMAIVLGYQGLIGVRFWEW